MVTGQAWQRERECRESHDGGPRDTHSSHLNQSINNPFQSRPPCPARADSAQQCPASQGAPSQAEATRTKGADTETPTRNPKPSISAPFPPIPAVSKISDVPQFCFDRRQVQAFNLGCEAPDAGGPPGRKLPRPRSQATGDRRRAASRVARVPRT